MPEASTRINLSSETSHSLYVYRRALNITDRVLGVIMSSARKNGIPTPQLTQLPLGSAILNAGEVRRFHQEVGVMPTEQGIDELGDYLHDHMPASAGTIIRVDSLPSALHTDRRRPSRHFVGLGANNPEIQDEKAAAVTLLQDYFGTSVGLMENDRYTHILMGRFSNDKEARAAHAFQDFIHRHPDLLPAQIELGPICVENIYPTLDTEQLAVQNS